MNKANPSDAIVHYLKDILDTSSGEFLPYEGNAWADIFSLADYFNIYHYLASRILHESHESLTDDFRYKLNTALVINKTRNTVLMSQIVSLARLYNHAEIPVLFLKGASTLLRGFCSSEERLLRDIDILVEPQKVASCRRLLESAGYRPVDNAVVSDRHHHAVPYKHPFEAGAVEIHHEPYSYGAVGGFTLPDIWRHFENATVQGEQVSLPSVNDHVWILIRTGGSGRMFLPRLCEAMEYSKILKQGHIVDFDLLSKYAHLSEMPNILAGVDFAASRYFGTAENVSYDRKLLESWWKWSLETRKKLITGCRMPATRRRFGATVFLAGKGKRTKVRFFFMLLRNEFHYEINSSKKKSYDFLWRMFWTAKKLMSFVLLSLHYYLLPSHWKLNNKNAHLHNVLFPG